MAVRKKQDENLKALRDLGALGGNRECFDCGQRGPTYINMTIGSFVCSQCSGILRGLTPPHRVKSISMATFTQDELEFIRVHGNTECAKTWLGLWNVSDAKRSRGPTQQASDQREHIIDKYEKQRYYLQPASPLKSIGAAAVGGLRNGHGSAGSSVGAGSTTNSSSHPSSPASSSTASVTSDNNNNNNIQNQLNLKAIQLTPPASTRTSGRHHQQQQQQQSHHVLNNNIAGAAAGGGSSRLHNNSGSGGGSSSSSTTNSSHNGNGNAFGEDSLFSQASQQQVQQQQQQPWANLNNNTNSLFDTTTVGRVAGGQSNGTSPGLKLNNSHQSTTITPGMPSNHSTMMTARPVAGQGGTTTAGIGGFIADFGSADIIFNGNVISGQNGFASNGNGFLGKPTSARGGGNGFVAADKLNGNVVQNGAFGTRKQEENFADFDHNPIFNSAGAMPMSSSNNSSMASTPSADRYAALKDLDEQIREIKVKEVQQQQHQQVIQQPAPFTNPNPFKAAPTNPFSTETNLFTAAPVAAHTAFNGFHSSPTNGFNGSNIFGQMGVNGTGMPNKSNNPFLCQF